MNITIDKNKILERVKTDSYYTGEAAKVGDYDSKTIAAMSQASDDDDNTLSSYMDIAASVVSDTIYQALDKRQPLTGIGDSGQSYVFTLLQPTTFPETLIPSITESIMAYIAAYTLYRWLKNINPQMADTSEFESHLSDINHRVNQRTKPVRRPVMPMNF